MRLRGPARALLIAALSLAAGGLAVAQTEPPPPFQSVPAQPPAQPQAMGPGPNPTPYARPAPAQSPIVRPAPPPQIGELPPSEPAPTLPSEPAQPSSDETPEAVKPAQPRRTLYTAAVLQVLDKVTAETLRFEAPLHKPVRYKGLIFVVNTCQSGGLGQPKAVAHLEIDSQPIAMPGRPENPIKMVYRGWMFADTPGPHLFEHPVYDAWLIACKMAGS
jgi:hypothetical protein